MTIAPISNLIYTEITKENNSEEPCSPASVSWLKAILFCNALSKREGLEEVYTIHHEKKIEKFFGEVQQATISQFPEKNGYRLPTWKEWLHAATENQTKPSPCKIPTAGLSSMSVNSDFPKFKKILIFRNSRKSGFPRIWKFVIFRDSRKFRFSGIRKIRLLWNSGNPYRIFQKSRKSRFSGNPENPDFPEFR